VEGRFLQAADAAGLRAEAARAGAEGAAALFVSAGALGDPIVLAAGLAPVVPQLLLGARVQLDTDGRHPALLARELTCLDLVCEGRSVLCFAPPFAAPLAEAIFLCRALWHSGEVVHDGPCYPVRAPANRARPAGEGSPLIALDLSVGDELPSFLAGAADLLLRPDPGADVENPVACSLERV
jgi:alkanesulfonate monooxygenase SsuD/methylene tetrahydromethanopterin reductase-like flavin-dependent oxidoreductase (luciferase family)